VVSQLLQKLHCPALIQFLGACLESPPRLVFEFMSGGSLHDLLHHNLAFREALAADPKLLVHLALNIGRPPPPPPPTPSSTLALLCVAGRVESLVVGRVMCHVSRRLWSVADRLEDVRCAATGMQFLHASKITHCDLTPNNILVRAPPPSLPPQTPNYARNWKRSTARAIYCRSLLHILRIERATLL
jgi:serine/threonine protein kinase